MYRQLFIAFFCFIVGFPTLADDVLSIGVLSKRGDEIAHQRWDSTANYLSRAVNGYQFNIQALGFNELEQAVSQKSIDFVITNTLYYSMLEHEYGVIRIATLENLGPNDETLTSFGGVIFVRNNSDIDTIKALKGRKFAAVEEESFGGWMMARKALREQGVEQEDFSSLSFLETHDNVVFSVLSGEYDAGTVRTDTLERMAQEGKIDLKQVRVLGLKTIDQFPYLASTELYPEWPFANLPNVPPDITQQVLLALLHMSSSDQAAMDAKISGWSSPLDYSKVEQLLKEFKLGPYDDESDGISNVDSSASLTDVWGVEEIFAAIIFTIIASLIVYRYRTKTRLLDIRLATFNVLLISFEISVILLLLFDIVYLNHLETMQNDATNQRFKMTSVADELRQSSDDLTHYARAFVITGNPEFRARYQQILDIRNGVAPRPHNYQNIYWDLKQPYRKTLHPDEKKIALKDVIESLPFSKTERELLLASERNSNKLVNIEVQAFAEHEIGHRQHAIPLLFSQDYYSAKHDIMLPIDKMMSLLDARTHSQVERINQKIHRQFHYLLALVVIFILGNIVAYWLLRKKVNRPIAYLTEVIEQYKNHENVMPQQHFNNDEIGIMIEQFFAMQNEIKTANDLILEQKLFLNTLVDSQHQIMMTMNSDEKILSVNHAFNQCFDVQDIVQFHHRYSTSLFSDLFINDLEQAQIERANWLMRLSHQSRQTPLIVHLDINNHEVIFALTVTLLPSNDKLYSVTLTEITEQERAKRQIEELLSSVKSSIDYAALIQYALIPTPNAMQQSFADYFAIWQPRNVVGGDIYLLEELRHKDELLLMVIDCTGHGVAGAFVSMLVKAIERQMVNNIQRNDSLDVSPAKLLTTFNASIRQLLNQHKMESASNVGLDGGIVYINRSDNVIRYAGANMSLYRNRKHNVEVLRGDKHSIGYKSSNEEFVFTDHEFEIEDYTQFYLPTDGFLDQNGGDKGFPFGRSNFIKLIKKYHHLPLSQQESHFVRALDDYRGEEMINDDITLVAFSVNSASQTHNVSKNRG